jgi:hypothetical protein
MLGSRTSRVSAVLGEVWVRFSLYASPTRNNLASLVKKPRDNCQDQGEQRGKNDLHVKSPHPLLIRLYPIDLSALHRGPVRRTIRSIGLHDAVLSDFGIRRQRRSFTPEKQVSCFHGKAGKAGENSASEQKKSHWDASPIASCSSWPHSFGSPIL